MERFSDLLSDALSEASVPTFADGDFDFEDLDYFDKEFEGYKREIRPEKRQTKEDSAETSASFGVETMDINMTLNDDEEIKVDCHSDRTPEEDYASSDGESEPEGSISGGSDCDEEGDMGTGEKPWALSMSEGSNDELRHGEREDGIFAEGRPPSPKSAERPREGNQEHGEGEGDEVSNFGRVPECGNELWMKRDEMEEDEHGRDVVDVPSEGHGETMEHFSGEEYEGAGERFAGSPFSSGKYVEHGVKRQESNSPYGLLTKQNECLEGAAADMSPMLMKEDGDDWENWYLHIRDSNAYEGGSADLEGGDTDGRETEDVSADALVTGCDDGEETGETDSHGSSDDELQVRRRDKEALDDSPARDPKDNDGATWLDRSNDQANPSKDWDLARWKTASVTSEDPPTAGDTPEGQGILSDASRPPAEYADSQSVLQADNGEPISPACCGSLDDGFFNCEPEASEVSELGPLGEDETQEQMCWDQEKDRIEAFYKFYNDGEGENEIEEREIKVQFSQVIHYQTDSSDTNPISSSTDGDEDLSSAETSEELREPDDTFQTKPACDHPNSQMPETSGDTQTCSGKRKMLKLILKMGLVIGTGLLMFWLIIDQPHCLGQV